MCPGSVRRRNQWCLPFLQTTSRLDGAIGEVWFDGDFLNETFFNETHLTRSWEAASDLHSSFFFVFLFFWRPQRTLSRRCFWVCCFFGDRLGPSRVVFFCSFVLFSFFGGRLGPAPVCFFGFLVFENTGRHRLSLVKNYVDILASMGDK